jgi:hypothetical protein
MASSRTELFIELFSEEIPARMQRGAAAELERVLTAALSVIDPTNVATWFGPRRIALRAEVAAEVAAASSTERGPRASAPEQALAGFLRKHGATREQLRQEGDFWVLDKQSAAISAASLIAATMPGLLRRFAWPKSMRWGGSSSFVWVRPLRRITCRARPSQRRPDRGPSFPRPRCVRRDLGRELATGIGSAPCAGRCRRPQAGHCRPRRRPGRRKAPVRGGRPRPVG